MQEDKKLKLHYGSISFYIVTINSIFILYHVDAYVNIYKIDKTSFFIGETIFMIWNSINDPIFGWLTDRNFLTNTNKINSETVCKKRVYQLKIYGPCLALVFLLIWFPFEHSFLWLQFTLCLCLYDTFLTIIDLQYSSLLADLTISSTSRNEYNYYSSMFSAIASISIFISYSIWCSDNYFNFQLFCSILTFIAFFGFYYSSKYFSSKLAILSKTHGSESNLSVVKKIENNGFSKENESKDVKQQSNIIFAYVKCVFKHKNLLFFSLMNLVQVFSCHFNSNFFPLWLDNLLNTTITPFIGSCLIGFSFLLPHVLNMYLVRLCDKYGTYHIINCLFLIKFSMAVFMFAIGKQFQLFICLFILSNRIFTEGTCKLLNLIITDLVDEDYVLNKRRTPISALIFGTTSFLAKPGQTLAPLLGTLFISQETGVDLFDAKTTPSSPLNVINIRQNSAQKDDVYRNGCFQILIIVPIVCAMLQLILWSKFDLHSKKLKDIKEQRTGHIKQPETV